MDLVSVLPSPSPHFHGLTWQPTLCFYTTQWSLPKTPKLLSSFKLWIQRSRVLVKLIKKVKTPATVYSENFMTNENRNIVFSPSPPPPCTVLSWYIFNLRAHLASICSWCMALNQRHQVQTFVSHRKSFFLSNMFFPLTKLLGNYA